MSKCECCKKENNELFCVYNEFLPVFSYKICRNCMKEKNIPYWGIVGLLASPTDWFSLGEELTKEAKDMLFTQAKKLYHKPHSMVIEDINKAKKELQNEKNKKGNLK